MPDDSEYPPWQHLVSAVVVQAINDARQGDLYAEHWLDHTGAALADLALDVGPDVLNQWRRRARARAAPRRTG